MEDFMLELVEVSDQSEHTYVSQFLRLRLEAIQLALGNRQDESLLEQNTEWMEDAIVCLKDQVAQNQLK
jgi:hypothetical protein